MVNLSIFADRLNELMIDAATSADALSKAIAVDLSLIYKYLRKEYTPSTFNAIGIAKYFKCSLDYIFGLSEDSDIILNKEYQSFANRFKELLIKNNCTRYRLKKDTALAKQTVDDWYSGKRQPSIDNILVLATYFDCTMEYVIGLIN